MLDQLLVVRLDCEVGLHCSLTEKVLLLLGVLEEFTVRVFFSLRNLVVEVLDVFESCLRDVLAVCEIVLGVCCQENEGLVVLNKIATDTVKLSSKTLILLTILRNYTNSK